MPGLPEEVEVNVTDGIKRKLDLMTATIKGAEEKLQAAGACVTVTHDDLTWERWKGRFRICMNGKPLLENPIEDRVRGYKQLDPLVTAAFKKATELLKEIEDSDE